MFCGIEDAGVVRKSRAGRDRTGHIFALLLPFQYVHASSFRAESSDLSAIYALTLFLDMFVVERDLRVDLSLFFATLYA